MILIQEEVRVRGMERIEGQDVLRMIRRKRMKKCVMRRLKKKNKHSKE